METVLYRTLLYRYYLLFTGTTVSQSVTTATSQTVTQTSGMIIQYSSVTIGHWQIARHIWLLTLTSPECT